MIKYDLVNGMIATEDSENKKYQLLSAISAISKGQFMDTDDWGFSVFFLSGFEDSGMAEVTLNFGINLGTTNLIEDDNSPNINYYSYEYYDNFPNINYYSYKYSKRINVPCKVSQELVNHILGLFTTKS